ncbi:UNVERIFIED_ORG: hypothetical protein J2W19_002893 [Shinella zoogloeoides]|nr:hypothetical protein [Shinella zoogloeoides]
MAPRPLRDRSHWPAYAEQVAPDLFPLFSISFFHFELDFWPPIRLIALDGQYKF